MAEVFSISGAEMPFQGYPFRLRGLGAVAAAPPGWQTYGTSYGGIAKTCPKAYKTGAKCRSSSGLGLQHALRVLGQTVGDKRLMIGADGFVGPGTVAAVNIAFTTHVGAGQAPQQYRTGKLTLFQVAQSCATLRALVENEVERRGRYVPPPIVAPPGGTAIPPLPSDKKCPKGQVFDTVAKRCVAGKTSPPPKPPSPPPRPPTTVCKAGYYKDASGRCVQTVPPTPPTPPIALPANWKRYAIIAGVVLVGGGIAAAMFRG